MNQTNYVISKNYFEALAKSTSDTVILIDPIDFSIIFINKYHQSYKLEDLIGQKVFHFVSPDHIKVYKKALEHVLETGLEKTIDLETKSLISPSGKLFFQCKIIAVKNSGNHIESILVIAKDISN